MNNLFLAATNAQQGGNMLTIVLFIAFFAATYFMLIRGPKKQQQERQKMLDQVKVGDYVMLRDGLYGNVYSLNEQDNTVVLDCDGIYLTFALGAVAKVVKQSETTSADKATTQDVETEKE